MNNNNRGNNRRRGRGNRPGGGGNGQQLNRIDSRARGNAPQLLEKYRKLAQDAHLNGDRVQAEYYLQFADHYFRVLADQRLRQEEQQRGGRGNDRSQDDGGDSGDDGDFGDNNDFPSFDQPYQRREQQDDRPQREERAARDERPAREERPRREDRPRRQERPQRDVEVAEDEAPQPAAADSANPYEPPENPFVRGSRGLKPRRADRAAPAGDAGNDSDGAQVFDPASLPPSIARKPVEADDSSDTGETAEAKPRRRAPRRKPTADDAVEAVADA